MSLLRVCELGRFGSDYTSSQLEIKKQALVTYWLAAGQVDRSKVIIQKLLRKS